MENMEFTAMVVSETPEGQFETNITTRNIRDLPDGEVLINVRYSSLNYKDALSTVGNRGVTRKYPHTPGIDAAGVVKESKSAAFNVGDEVLVTGYDLGMNTPGGFAEYIRVPAEWVVPLPPGLTLRESMIYGTAGFTAALSCHKLMENGVTPEKGKVLVTGAAGGVGSIALAILAKAGFTVTAVNSHMDRTDFLKSIGASEVISIEEATDSSGKLMGGKLWAGVVDAVGGDILATAMKSTKHWACVAVCGNVGSGELHTSVYPYILRGITVVGIDSAHCDMETRIKVWEMLANQWKLDHLDALTTEVAGLGELKEQIELMFEHKRKGRTIVRVSSAP